MIFKRRDQSKLLLFPRRGLILVSTYVQYSTVLPPFPTLPSIYQTGSPRFSGATGPKTQVGGLPV